MGKHEVGTPKYIANKIKAKGLQKLRWYCQMCQKQCRDENGFKCHTMSESHQRQLLLFADNAHKFIDDFSKEFADGYLELLSRTCGTKRVPANKVYQDYITDRNHLHMNATQWETLTEFVKWLGREGKCVVDETEKGWFVTYIDRDPEAIAMQEAMAKKEKMDKDDDERMMDFIQKQVERGKQKEMPAPVYTDLQRKNDDEKIVLDLKLAATKPKVKETFLVPSSAFTAKKAKSSSSSEASNSDVKLKRSALDEILEEEEIQKERKNRKDYWLHEGIVVKVISPALGVTYYKKKGYVEEVVDRYAGKIRMLDSQSLVKFDQKHLETVIPAEGRKVLIVNGAYRGKTAKMRRLLEKEFSATLEICSGPLKGRTLPKIPYEDFSKLHDPE